MSKFAKLISILAVFGLLTLAITSPVRAFENREGETVVIEKGEVIEDDLYITAATVVVDGTIKGDLVAFGQTITINGVVEGDLMAAGQTVIINGQVKDDARIAGAALQVGTEATIGDDLVAGGASLETMAGSHVGGDLVVGSGQALLAGDVAGDVIAGTAALELRGKFGGNVEAYVEMTAESEDMPPMNMYMTQSPISLPTVPGGLTVDEGATIAGDLTYSSAFELPIPSGVVSGKVTRTEPEIHTEAIEVQPTKGEQVTSWAVDLVRRIVTVILVGLLLNWLFPNFLRNTTGKLHSQFWASLGWGFISGVIFIFAGSVIFVATWLLAITLWAFTLSGLGWSALIIGSTIQITMTTFIILTVAYLVIIIFGSFVGKWLLGLFSPSFAEHKIWPMIVGVIIVVAGIDILRFPLLPIQPTGILLYFVITLFGFGALWLWGRERFGKPVVSNP
ncbi:MAG: polymer-forming cytoskeletal protein [Chloroflexi bacterium]|nr:polymer-forming cytoskeletal protein [Chloroflexota bacterium]